MATEHDIVGPSSACYLISQNEIADVLGITSNAVSMAAAKLGLQPRRLGRRALFPTSAARILFEERGFKYPKEIISFQMLKGGQPKRVLLSTLRFA